jgi:hypothetical protein
MTFSISKVHTSGGVTPMFTLLGGEVDNKFHDMHRGEKREFNPTSPPKWAKKNPKGFKYQIKRTA